MLRMRGRQLGMTVFTDSNSFSSSYSSSKGMF